ncbi:MAG: RNA polymerase sigma factor [Planctomycetota bacterium]|nr:RNA polymerase sigma factor [Planctomycetota bacterium]
MPGQEADESRSDQQLIAAANAGDEDAFEALYDRYRDWVINLALRFTGDRDLALDVMQDVFLYFAGRFPGFELTAQLRTFLYPAVRHTALAAKRKHHRYWTSSRVSASACVFTSPPPPPEGLAPLADAMETLPPGQREVIILRFADGLSLEEIARAVEIPLGTVKSRLHHALRALRADERLRDYFDE